jgi:hypothetical protein
MVHSFGIALLALTVYGVGKTFFWPTMLAVASDRFPRTGAIAISFMGGIGMLSAGLIGGPGLGYAKDRFAGETLQEKNPAIFAEYKAEKPSSFLFFADASGLDGKKYGEAAAKPVADRNEVEKTVVEASITGDRRTLVADSFIPGAMALIYLLVLFYFKSIGGYKRVEITAGQAAGGTAGPAEY